MKEKISVIVPIYKVEKELDRCVKSIIKQTYSDLEIILVDDGSPDHCPKICDEYASVDCRVRVIHKKNGGLSDARNVGLKEATGDYILYVDADDYIELDACERFMRAASDKKVDIIVGNAIMEKPSGKERMIHSATPSGVIYSAKEFIIKAVRAHQWYAPACFNMYRREYLIVNDLYFKKNIYFEDMQMLPRVFLPAGRIACTDGIFYHYVVRENSIMTSERDDRKKNDSIQNLREWKMAFDKVNDDELRRCLYGMLIKCYLHESRLYGITKWEIEGLNLEFALKNSLNLKERIKSLAFSVFPILYGKILGGLGN